MAKCEGTPVNVGTGNDKESFCVTRITNAQKPQAAPQPAKDAQGSPQAASQPAKETQTAPQPAKEAKEAQASPQTAPQPAKEAKEAQASPQTAPQPAKNSAPQTKGGAKKAAQKVHMIGGKRMHNVYMDGKKKYIQVSGKKVFLSTIRGKYRYV